MFLSRRKNATDEVAKSSASAESKKDNKAVKKPRRGDEEIAPVVDISKSLSRALHNPLKDPRPIEGSSLGRDNIIKTLTTLESAFFVIDRVKELALEASHVVLKASATDDLGNRNMLAERYDDVRQSIDLTIEDAEEDARALLGRQQLPIVLQLGERSTYTIPAAQLDCSETGLNLIPPITGFSEAEEISDILRCLDKALEKVETVSNLFMKDARYLTSKIPA